MLNPYNWRETERLEHYILAEMENPRTWHKILWKFGFYFAVNYASCTLVLYLTGNVLYSILLLICYVFVAKSRSDSFSTNAKGHSWTQYSLVEELKNIDINKRSFVIERFVRMDRKRNERKSTICDSERCVVCLDEKAEIQTLPCRHRVICGLCAWETFKMALKKSDLHTCVVCRCQIRDYNGSLFRNLLNLTWQDVRTILDETKATQTHIHK